MLIRVGPGLNDFQQQGEKHFLKIARKVVNSNSSLLLLGETGVGKERLALAIHNESQRRHEPFIPINCAALPENLLESELFGHEQGAFTGAIRTRRGAFELAHRGTIFLDEVGDMPLHLQAKLLRVLQEKEFQKIGGEKALKVDVRVMAATNHDLPKAVQNKLFRRDLFYRLSVVSIEIPPLRERPEDIESLVEYFTKNLSAESEKSKTTVSTAAMTALKNYEWPGNVRELMNVIERALLLGDGRRIELEDLPPEIISNKSCDNPPDLMPETVISQSELNSLPWKYARKLWLDRLEKIYFENLLKSCNGKIGETAKRAGITARALHQKMTQHGIDKKDFK
ncbi:MAG: sigma-54 interaction domain-containing protein [Candidatus Rifleibacteriota bacterium]